MIPHRTKRIVAAVLSPDFMHLKAIMKGITGRAITYRDNNNNLGMLLTKSTNSETIRQITKKNSISNIVTYIVELQDKFSTKIQKVRGMIAHSSFWRRIRRIDAANIQF